MLDGTRPCDIRSSNSEPYRQVKLEAFLEFARKLTLTPGAVKSGDIALLRSANMSEAAILDGTLVVAGFSLINRVASALHFETPCPRDFLLSAWFLRIVGYRFLCGFQIGSSGLAPVLGGTDENRPRFGDRARPVASLT